MFYVFLTTPVELGKCVELMQSSSSDNCIYHYNVKILNLFDPELQLVNTKPIIINQLKVLLCKLENFKDQSTLALEYKKKNNHRSMHKVLH